MYYLADFATNEDESTIGIYGKRKYAGWGEKYGGYAGAGLGGYYGLKRVFTSPKYKKLSLGKKLLGATGASLMGGTIGSIGGYGVDLLTGARKRNYENSKANFSSPDEQGGGAPMWTMVTGRTIPGILARGGVIGGAYGVKKFIDYKPKIRQREIYNQLTGNTLWDKTKRRVPGVIAGTKRGLVGLGSGLAVGGSVVGLGLLGKKAYDQYRERNKKWWEL